MLARHHELSLILFTNFRRYIITTTAAAATEKKTLYKKKVQELFTSEIIMQNS